MIEYLIIFVFVGCFIFLPGYLLITLGFEPNTFSIPEHTGLSFALGLPFIALLQFFVWVFDIHSPWVSLSIWLGVLLIMAVFIRIQKCSFPKIDFQLLVLYAAFSFYIFFWVFVLPGYQMAYTDDWYLYYPNISFYTGMLSIDHFQETLANEYLVRRTPFYSLITSFFLNIFGTTYPYFQTVTVLLGSLLFWALYLIPLRLFNSRVAIATLFFLPVVPILITNLGIPTPKPVMSFLILLAYFIYLPARTQKSLKSGHAFLVSTFVVTAIMFHPSAVFYCVWIYLDVLQLWVRKKIASPAKLLVSSMCVGALMAGSWSAAMVHQVGYIEFFGLSSTISGHSIGWIEYFFTRLVIIITSLVIPLTMPVKEALLGGVPFLSWNQFLDVWGNFSLRAHLETLLGGMTYLGCLAVWLGLKRYSTSNDTSFSGILTYFTIAGAVTCVLVHLLVDFKGLAFVMMSPLVIALFVQGAALTLEFPMRFKVTLLGLMSLEFLFHRWIAYSVSSLNKSELVYFNQPDLIFLHDLIDVQNGHWFSYAMILVCVVIYYRGISLLK